MHIDLNCDIGEGMTTDAHIIPFISSANIACGFHAGNEDTIRQTIELCLQYNVAIGAHPSWPDKENFGRKEMHLPEQELFNCITEQLYIITRIASAYNTKMHHVKPHGALYNQSAKDRNIAATIAMAVKAFDASLLLFGLSGSCSLTEAEQEGLHTAHEVFADRTYQDNGSLTPRSQPNALIESEEKAVSQAIQMIEKGTVETVSGTLIRVKADTICLHGDGKHAVAFCRNIHQQLKQNKIEIKAV